MSQVQEKADNGDKLTYDVLYISAHDNLEMKYLHSTPFIVMLFLQKNEGPSFDMVPGQDLAVKKKKWFSLKKSAEGGQGVASPPASVKS
jgi:hypothetical protein